MNKFGIKDVLELQVFDEDGRFIATLDVANRSQIISNENGDYICLESALFDIELLRFQQDSKADLKTDIDIVLEKIKKTPLSIKKDREHKKCKLIGKTLFRSKETLNDEVIHFHIPNALLMNDIEFTGDSCSPSTFYTAFEIKPDDNDDLMIVYGF